jgi:hypothetical protein
MRDPWAVGLVAKITTYLKEAPMPALLERSRVDAFEIDELFVDFAYDLTADTDVREAEATRRAEKEKRVLAERLASEERARRAAAEAARRRLAELLTSRAMASFD